MEKLKSIVGSVHPMLVLVLQMESKQKNTEPLLPVSKTPQGKFWIRSYIKIVLHVSSYYILVILTFQHSFLENKNTNPNCWGFRLSCRDVKWVQANMDVDGYT